MSRAAPRVLADMMKRLKAAEEEPLRALLDEYLLKRDSSAQRYAGHPISMIQRPRPSGRISPSSVYGCERQAVLKFAGVKGRKKIDPDQELLFEDGNWRHHKWQYLFYDMEAVLGRDRFRMLAMELPVNIPEMYVAGSLDAEIAIKNPKTGKWRFYIVDFKGINDRGFNWINSTDEAKGDNIRQLLLYMKARQRKRGILLYDNKDKNLPRTFTVDFSDEKWSETLDWIDRVIDQLRNKRMPTKSVECRPGTMMHESCMFRRLCWGRLDTTDLQEMTYHPDNWQGIEAAWEAGNS